MAGDLSPAAACCSPCGLMGEAARSSASKQVLSADEELIQLSELPDVQMDIAASLRVRPEANAAGQVHVL